MVPPRSGVSRKLRLGRCLWRRSASEGGFGSIAPPGYDRGGPPVGSGGPPIQCPGSKVVRHAR